MGGILWFAVVRVDLLQVNHKSTSRQEFQGQRSEPFRLSMVRVSALGLDRLCQLVILHYQHNFRLFWEKSAASIICTFTEYV